MIHLPDTNAFSAYLSGKSPMLVARMVAAMADGSVRLSVVVLSELEFGAEKSYQERGESKFLRRVENLRKLIEVEPLGDNVPRQYARVRLFLEQAGQKIGDRDTLIAAHALALSATLITRNVREFARVPGLKVENWQTD